MKVIQRTASFLEVRKKGSVSFSVEVRAEVEGSLSVSVSADSFCFIPRVSEHKADINMPRIGLALCLYDFTTVECWTENYLVHCVSQ